MPNHRMMQAIAEGLKPVIGEAFQKAITPLLVRLAAVEARTVEKGDKGDPGDDGRDGADGQSGKDGKDGQDGAPGRDGIDGKDGEPGKDADPAFIERLVDFTVANAVAKVPPAPAGRDGQAGIPGRDGKDGEPGADGKDGFGLDDFDVKSEDGGRTFIFSFNREGREPITKSVKTDLVLYRGVWKDGPWQKGDSVTWDGSTWIAFEDTDEKPGIGKGWRLAVKRGQNGKDGVLKPPPEPKPIALK